jgi:hypothetical protein
MILMHHVYNLAQWTRAAATHVRCKLEVRELLQQDTTLKYL